MANSNMDEINYANSTPPTKGKRSKRVLFFGLFFLIVLALLGTLGYFLTRGSSTDKETKTITINEPSQAPEEASPSPTSSEIDRSSVKLAVQNGSGTPGAAGKVADSLKKLGYEIASTGNADNFEYKDVVIQVKSSNKDLLSLLKDDLSKDYTIGSTSADLSSSATYDALIVVGK